MFLRTNRLAELGVKSALPRSAAPHRPQTSAAEVYIRTAPFELPLPWQDTAADRAETEEPADSALPSDGPAPDVLSDLVTELVRPVDPAQRADAACPDELLLLLPLASLVLALLVRQQSARRPRSPRGGGARLRLSPSNPVVAAAGRPLPAVQGGLPPPPA